jgi:hypothetical protein
VELTNPLDETSQTTNDCKWHSLLSFPRNPQKVQGSWSFCNKFSTVGMMYQYFLKIVSTEFRYLNGKRLYTNQYSVTEHERNIVTQHGQDGLPGT